MASFIGDPSLFIDRMLLTISRDDKRVILNSMVRSKEYPRSERVFARLESESLCRIVRLGQMNIWFRQGDTNDSNNQ